jgi:L-seryl-tRNA(Ser) seleniumtransferase
MAKTKPLAADLRRGVPSVDEALRKPGMKALEERYGRTLVVDALREETAALRDTAAGGNADALQAALARLAESVDERIAERMAPSLVTVINATGVVIHTNLGRAPLSPEAVARVATVAAGYSNLELDLESGERGDRESHAEARLRRVLGCPATVAVNNNAAAVLLAVNTLAEGRDVLVSRGELVEIGGSFRIPDVVKKAGGRLREVGTTNRTRLSDYRAALGPDTGVLLKVHPSNFRIVGFTEQASREELAELARETGVPLVEDLGSGLLAPLPPPLDGEETVAQALRGGLDLVTFSGDKLLGGPQAGLAAGRADLVARMRRNPLYRALRVDKMTLAALDVVLADHEASRALDRVPVLRALHRPLADVREAAARVLKALDIAGDASLQDGVSAVGGGAAPGVEIPTVLIRLRTAHAPAASLARALRRGRPPVITRVADDAVWLDVRTVTRAEEEVLAQALRDALRRPISR